MLNGVDHCLQTAPHHPGGEEGQVQERRLRPGERRAGEKSTGGASKSRLNCYTVRITCNCVSDTKGDYLPLVHVMFSTRRNVQSCPDHRGDWSSPSTQRRDC